MELFNESNERPLDVKLDADLIKQLGSLGLYDASQDTCSSPDHPEDNKWTVEGKNQNGIQQRNTL